MHSGQLTSPLAESIIKTVLYYDIFNYPLTQSEIVRSLSTDQFSTVELERELDELVRQSIIFKLGEFYSLQNNPELAARRVKGNALAKKYMIVAQEKARLIFSFPFVRSVMVSGSLSKGYADDASDIDFFIITSPGRLWIARTLLVMYKRIFLFNSHKYFCVNYFMDDQHLEVEEKNLFTATELVTLVPMYGKHYFEHLLNRNTWVRQYFPNLQEEHMTNEEAPIGQIKKGLEWLLNRCAPQALDRFFMTLTLKRWKNNYGHSHASDEFRVAFKTNRHVSKNHPQNYQKKIVDQYEKKLHTFLKRTMLPDPVL
ncbi:MAG: hypothetical protein K2U26_03045 [Cyclobacteriaceae bacterium]|nr:hypothetical protein [Cyclobacteriaceae bacterium]